MRQIECKGSGHSSSNLIIRNAMLPFYIMFFVISVNTGAHLPHQNTNILCDVPADAVHRIPLIFSSSEAKYCFGLLTKLASLVRKLEAISSLQMIENDSCLVLSQDSSISSKPSQFDNPHIGVRINDYNDWVTSAEISWCFNIVKILASESNLENFNVLISFEAEINEGFLYLVESPGNLYNTED